jgi:GAF domain-containing protein
VHLRDVLAESDAEFGTLKALARTIGLRSMLVAPLLREGIAIGAIAMRRTEVHPFTDKQINLLKTFADQAVIAIENARMLTELQKRNEDLTEALEQQTATSEILRAISTSPNSLDSVFSLILAKAARLAETDVSVLWIHEGGGLMRCAAAHGSSLEYGRWLMLNPQRFEKPFYRPVGPWRTREYADARETTAYREGAEFWKKTCDAEGLRTLLSVPLVIEGRLVGSFAVARRDVRSFSARHRALLETFADQAVLAIENARLFTELASRNRDLTQALEQQTASAEVLKVMASSPAHVQPVFDAIVRSVTRLCGGIFSALDVFDGESIHRAA